MKGAVAPRRIALLVSPLAPAHRLPRSDLADLSAKALKARVTAISRPERMIGSAIAAARASNRFPSTECLSASAISPREKISSLVIAIFTFPHPTFAPLCEGRFRQFTGCLDSEGTEQGDTADHGGIPYLHGVGRHEQGEESWIPFGGGIRQEEWCSQVRRGVEPDWGPEM